MKKLNSNSKFGCPFNEEIFTNEVMEHIIDEGFEWKNNNDSYQELTEDRVLLNYGCYKKYEDGNGFDIFIYICEDGIEVDQDYDCGGNMSSVLFKYNGDFEQAYDSMVDYVEKLKN